VHFGFWFLICYAATQLELQLHQKRIQVVRSTKVVRRIPTESNGTPAMDLGFEDTSIRRFTNKRTGNTTKHISITAILYFFLGFESTELVRKVQQERTQMEVQ